MTEGLTREAAALTATVQELATATSELASGHRRIRRVVTWTIIGLVLDLILTVCAGILFHNQREAQNRIDRNAAGIVAVQNRTSNEVLCPLYQVFLNSYDKQRRDALPPAKRAQYDQAFVVIRQGYATLRCSGR